MNRLLLTSFALLILLPQAALAQAAPAARLSDEAIQRDHAGYESMQARLKALNEKAGAGGRPLGDYHLAKAQCWLDASWHEYTRNDRGAFPQAALGESEKLVALMEQHAEPLPSETPLAGGAARLRADLWQRVHGIKQGPGLGCAAQKTACAEVALVHAGNEFSQQGWRHAKPYVHLAEDGIDAAEALARNCRPSTQTPRP